MTDENDLELRRRLRRLAEPREPARDLWPGIAAALPGAGTQRGPLRYPAATFARSAPRPQRWAWATAAVVVLGLGLLLAPRLADPPPAPDTLAATAPMAAPEDAVGTLLEAYHLVLVSEREGRLDDPGQLTAPGAVERIAAAREIDVSLARMAAALRLQPDSQLLRRLMHQTLQQRADLARAAFNA